MRLITDSEINNLIQEAQASPRKRAHILLHKDPEEQVHRMINALVPGTYVQPHRHKEPPKTESFSILKGRVACLAYSDSGEVETVHLLDETGPVKVVDIEPGIFHSLVALAPSAVFEIIQGPWSKETHKQFAPWAPSEEDGHAQEYLNTIELTVNRVLRGHTD